MSAMEQVANLPRGVLDHFRRERFMLADFRFRGISSLFFHGERLARFLERVAERAVTYIVEKGGK